MEWTEDAYLSLNDVFVKHAPASKYVSIRNNHPFGSENTLHFYVQKYYSQEDLDALDVNKIRNLCTDIGCIGRNDPQNYRINKSHHKWVYQKKSPPPMDGSGSLVAVRTQLEGCVKESRAAEQRGMVLVRWGTFVHEERRNARGWPAAIQSNGEPPKMQQEQRRESTGTNSDAMSLGSSADGPRWNLGEGTQRIDGQSSASDTMGPACQTRRQLICCLVLGMCLHGE